MRRPSRRWRDDTLGSTLRGGLARYRDAEPSDGVWERIAVEVQGSRRRPSRSISLSRATLLSVVVLAGMAVSGLGAQLQLSSGMRADYIESSTGSQGLTAVEHAVAARAVAPGPWDLRLPRTATGVSRVLAEPREAYNRESWLRQAVAAVGGAVQPLSSVVGQ